MSDSPSPIVIVTHKPLLAGGVATIFRGCLEPGTICISPNPVSDEQYRAQNGELKTHEKEGPQGVRIIQIDVPETPYNNHRAATADSLWFMLHELKKQVSDVARTLTGRQGLAQAMENHLRPVNELANIMSPKVNEVLQREFGGRAVDLLVQDYTVAGVKAKGMKNAYTWHTPVPSLESLKETKIGDTPYIQLPAIQDFFRAINSYDLVTVHRKVDEENFRKITEYLATTPYGVNPSSGALKGNGEPFFQPHFAEVRTVYVGIDPEANKKQARETSFSTEVSESLNKARGRSILFFAGRADPSKGVGVLGEGGLTDTISKFFERNPEKARDNCFLVVLEPTREDQGNYAKSRQATVEALQAVERAVYKRTGISNSVIVHNNGVKQPELMALMREPNVILGLGTAAWTDGHNLAMGREFVNVNGPDAFRPRGKGLILSEGLGAADLMGPAGAYVVPRGRQPEAWVRALEEFLSTSVEERNLRMDQMYAVSAEYTGQRFVSTVVGTLDNLPQRVTRFGTASSAASPAAALAPAPGFGSSKR